MDLISKSQMKRVATQMTPMQIAEEWEMLRTRNAELEQRIKELEAGQGEPAAWVEEENIWMTAGNFPFQFPAFNQKPSDVEGDFVPLYAKAAPSPTTQSAVAAFAMKAEEVCKSKYWEHRGESKLENENDEEFMRQCGLSGMANDILTEIRSLPHDDSALVEFGEACIKEYIYAMANGLWEGTPRNVVYCVIEGKRE